MPRFQIAKYKDIVARLKGLLVESQNKLQAKTKELEKLRPPFSTLSKIRPIALVRGAFEDWVLIEGERADGEGNDTRTIRHQFWIPDSECQDEKLSKPEEYVPLSRMVEIVSTEGAWVSKVFSYQFFIVQEEDCEKAKGDLARIEREFRQYRIRSGMTRLSNTFAV